MFIKNKYYIIYIKIINNAKNSNRIKNRARCNGVYERHHIIPKSLGGSNDIKNKVLLTPREHFLCHRILTKITSGKNKQKMIYAMWNLCHTGKENRREKMSSHVYANIREEYIQVAKSYKHSTDTIKKMKRNIKKSLKGMNFYGENNAMFEGWYITPWGKFGSANLAATASPYKTSPGVIRQRCKHENNKTITRRRPEYYPNEWVGKTNFEIGFNFDSK